MVVGSVLSKCYVSCSGNCVCQIIMIYLAINYHHNHLIAKLIMFVKKTFVC